MLTPRVPSRTCSNRAAKWSRLVTACDCLSLVLMIDVLSLVSHLIARYGSSANLVLSTGKGVHGFTLDPGLGEFILTHPDVRHKLGLLSPGSR